jgi:hypothetical protein
MAGVLSILVGLGFFLAAAAWLLWKGHMFSGVLLALGTLGWFAPAFLPAAGNRLRHVELPAFYETATIVGPAGRTFAFTQHLSRLQRYDLAGRFEAGWFVDSAGGKVAIGVTTDGKIAVAAVRTRRVEFFNPDGSFAGPSRPFTRDPKNWSDYLRPSEVRVDGVTFETPTVAKNPSVRWNTLLLFPLWGPEVAWFLGACGLLAGIVATRGRFWGKESQ